MNLFSLPYRQRLAHLLSEWSEADHPRDDVGRFAEGGGDGGGQAQGSGTDGSGRGAVPAAQASAPSGQGRPDADPVAAKVGDSYNEKHKLGKLTHGYAEVDQSRARTIADAYDDLPDDDGDNPRVAEAYTALAKEIEQQWDHITASGMKFEPWTKEGQPYQTSKDMAEDVKANQHMYFYTGGNPNKFMAAKDISGLSVNDKFRAVHDYFGHAAGGYGFGPRGEENAWISHSQMLTVSARRALTTETRGQNSWVNFGKQNYDKDGTYRNIPAGERPFAKQKLALLPDEFMRMPGEDVRHVRVREFKERMRTRAARQSSREPSSLSYREKLTLLVWDESDHPRDEAGRFAGDGGGAEDTLRSLLPAHEKLPATATISIGSDPLSKRVAGDMAKILTEMKDAGYTMPHGIEIGRSADTGVHGQAKRIGGVTYLTVLLPEKLPDDANMDDATFVSFDGFSDVSPKYAYNDPLYSKYERFAARTFKDVVTHEMGHLQAGHRGDMPYGKLLQEGTFGSRDAIFRAQMRVSEYARQNADEFLAESFTRLSRGEEIPEDSMKLYKALNGPDVKSPRKDLGGEGSGNWGHAGRPGEIGGSADGGGVASEKRQAFTELVQANERDQEWLQGMRVGLNDAWQKWSAETRDHKPKPLKADGAAAKKLASYKEAKALEEQFHKEYEAVSAREREMHVKAKEILKVPEADRSRVTFLYDDRAPLHPGVVSNAEKALRTLREYDGSGAFIAMKFPAESVDEFKKIFGDDSKIEKNDDGTYSLKSLLRLEKADGARAHATMAGIAITGGRDLDRQIHHEVAHHIELRDSEVRAAAIALREELADKPRVVYNLNADKPSLGDDEMALKGRFPDPYTSKLYKDDIATEIVSTGVEAYMADPVRFAKERPEHFNFIFDVLHGKYKKK